MTGLRSELLAEPTAWELDSIFAGGVDGAPFRAALEQAERDIAAFDGAVSALPAVAEAPAAWSDAMRATTRLWEQLGTVLSVSGCTYSANTAHEPARIARERAVRQVDRLEQINAQQLRRISEVGAPRRRRSPRSPRNCGSATRSCAISAT